MPRRYDFDLTTNFKSGHTVEGSGEQYTNLTMEEFEKELGYHEQSAGHLRPNDPITSYVIVAVLRADT